MAGTTVLLEWTDLVARYALAGKITGIIHCGAHLGEEAAEYAAAGISNVWWVEANPNVLEKIQQHVEPYSHRVLHALLWEEENVELPFHVTNYDGMSSSILEFGTHPNFSPDTVFVEEQTMCSATLDTLIDDFNINGINMLVMDLQGVEGRCLRGAVDLIPMLDFVMSEVNCDEVYKGCTRVEEIDDILYDFDRVETHWVGDQGWGDAFWVRRHG